MRLCACKSSLVGLRALATRYLRVVGVMSLVAAIVCGWQAHAAAWQAPIPGAGLAVRAPPSDSISMTVDDAVTFRSDSFSASSEVAAARIWTPGAFASLVSAESPVVDLPPPTFIPPLDEPPDDMTSGGPPTESPLAANNGCVTGPPAESAWKRRFWCLVPRGKIPYIAPRRPSDSLGVGRGEPMPGAGWHSQPFSITGFAGATAGGALIPGSVNQRPSFYGGVNFGWDYDDYWGIEKRLGFGVLDLTDGNHRQISTTGLSVTGEYRLMYYPLGDNRWRPFMTAGVGWSDFYFNDDQGTRHLDTTGVIVFGGGLKYLYSERIAIRVDLIDEVNFGTGPVSTFQYVALTAGLEFRYGKRLLNMPWHRKDGP